MTSFKKGLFNPETLTVKFGGPLSKPESVFEAKAVKVPDYKILVRERESLGGGWYGAMETIEKIVTDSYLILREGKIIGCMISPYHPKHNIKTDLLPMDYGGVHAPIKIFAEKYTNQQ